MRGQRYRLRELDRNGRLLAGLLASALLLAPAMAFIHFAGDFGPMNDNAFVALRAYDVGTLRTPLTGQPSFAEFYGEQEVHVDHLGALHFYLLAPFVRVLGASEGTLLVSALISGAAALIAVWVVFRELGRRAGMVAGVVMALVMFTAGAGSLMNPVSSAVAGYPLFCSAVLAWGLMCGDDRLLPLATGVLSFGVQMHLSVGPTMLVLGLVALVGVIVAWWRAGVVRNATAGLRAIRIGATSVVIGVVLWAPVILQQLFGKSPNLTALVRYASDSSVENKGRASALYQLANVLGWPPLLGRTNLHGFHLLNPPGTVSRLTAAMVLGVLVVAGARWWEESRPDGDGSPRSADASTAAHRRLLLVVMVGVLMVAGYLNGSRVPVGLEEARIVFYHWIWPLSFFVTLVVALLTWELAGPIVRGQEALKSLAAAWPPGTQRRVAAGAAVVVMVGLAVTSVRLERPTNSLFAVSSQQPRQVYESLADQIIGRRDALSAPVLLLTRGQVLIGEHHSGLALALEERGIPVLHSPTVRSFVSPDRIMEPEEVASALVLVVHRSPDWQSGIDGDDLPGRRIASYEVLPHVDMENYRYLVQQLEESAETARFGPEMDEYLVDKHGPEGRALFVTGLESLVTNPSGYLLDVNVVEALLEIPLESIDLDPARLERLRDDLKASTLPDGYRAELAFYMQVRLVTGDELDALLER